MTASADRTAWSDRTLPPPSAQAWATRSNAASLHVAGGGMRGREVEAHLANETRVFG